MKRLGLDHAADLRHGHRPPRADADQGVQRGRDPARDRAAQRRRHHHRPHRQPRHRRDGLHQGFARRQRRRPRAPPRCSRRRGCCRSHKFPGTIVYAALSGEEQGLLGGKILADYAKAQGWNVVANLNNDIIGNSCGSDKVCDAKTVRVFSEGPRWQGREDLAAPQRSLGGENDSPSRNLSRFLDTPRRALAEHRPRRPPDLAQRPLRPRRRPHRIPQRRLPRDPLLGRGRGLRPPAPGSARRERDQIRRHRRRNGFPLSGEGHPPQRRRARRARQRPAAAGAQGRGRSQHQTLRWTGTGLPGRPTMSCGGGEPMPISGSTKND